MADEQTTTQTTQTAEVPAATTATTQNAQGAQGGASTTGEKMFSQAELDRHIAERLNREGLKDLKAKAEAYDKYLESQKTQEQKAADAMAAVQKQNQELTARLKDVSLRSAVISAAVTANIIDPDAAYALLDKSKLTVADDGTVAGLTEAVAALAQAKPYLVKRAGDASSAGNFSKTPQGASDSAAIMARLGYGPAVSNPFAGPGGGVFSPQDKTGT